MKEELVDELWLSVHPIILGAGKPSRLSQKRQKTGVNLLKPLKTLNSCFRPGCLTVVLSHVYQAKKE